MGRTTRPPRVRRTAEEARERILEAAGLRLHAEGPAGLRLQEIAADVGVSHPTVLHHFGSREVLVRAVLAREVQRMEEELVAAVLALPVDASAPVEVLRRAMDAFVASGSARLVAHLALARASDPTIPATPHLRRLAEVIHTRRVERGGEAPFEDTLFAVLSVALAVVSDALLGDGPWVAMGLGVAARGRFHDWLLERASERIEGDANVSPPEAAHPSRRSRADEKRARSPKVTRKRS